MTGAEHLSPAAWLGRDVEVVVDRPLGSTHPDGWCTYRAETPEAFPAGVVAAASVMDGSVLRH